MPGPAQDQSHADVAVLLRLQQRVANAEREFEAAPDQEKISILMRLDRAVDDLTDALSYARTPRQ